MILKRHVEGTGFIKVVANEAAAQKLDVLRSTTRQSFRIVARDEELVFVLLQGAFAAKTTSGIHESPFRRNVFEDAPFALYVGPGGEVEVSLESNTQVALFRSTVKKTIKKLPESLPISPNEIRTYSVGVWNYRRTIREIIGEKGPSLNIIVAETLNPPGNWSGWPPHKHDEEEEFIEVPLEEVYLFKVDPAKYGFAVQLNYRYDGTDEAVIVRDDDVTVIKNGYHPIVAAPGCLVYYLWALAGPRKVMRARKDPNFAWQFREQILLREVLDNK